VPRFRKKPVEIEARQWDGSPEGATPIIDWVLGENCTASYCDPDESPSFPGGRLLIKTLEGYISASPGDYIIKGVQNEFYPCKPDIFEQTYDEVES
jgi:hypothetical protein